MGFGYATINFLDYNYSDLRRDFRRISLAPGQTKTVEFVITSDKLSFLDLSMKEAVEPGWFDIMVGTSSVKYETVKLEVVAK